MKTRKIIDISLIFVLLTIIFGNTSHATKGLARPTVDSLAQFSDSVNLQDSITPLFVVDRVPNIPILTRLENRDSTTNGRITIKTSTNVPLDNREERIVIGYRVRLFFDNSQTARKKASAVEAKIKERFPNEPVYLEYTAPYFNVSVGNYLSYTEAYINAQKFLKMYPKAFVVQENIPLSMFNGRCNDPKTDTTSTSGENNIE